MPASDPHDLRGKWITHVNRGVIDANRKHGRHDPAITVRKGKSGRSQPAMRVKLRGDSEVIYDPHNPILACGARMVIVSTEEPEIFL